MAGAPAGSGFFNSGFSGFENLPRKTLPLGVQKIPALRTERGIRETPC
jgi:hypothetical protein